MLTVRIALVRHAPVKFSGDRWIRPDGVADAVADSNVPFEGLDDAAVPVTIILRA